MVLPYVLAVVAAQIGASLGVLLAAGLMWRLDFRIGPGTLLYRVAPVLYRVAPVLRTGGHRAASSAELRPCRSRLSRGSNCSVTLRSTSHTGLRKCHSGDLAGSRRMVCRDCGSGNAPFLVFGPRRACCANADEARHSRGHLRLTPGRLVIRSCLIRRRLTCA